MTPQQPGSSEGAGRELVLIDLGRAAYAAVLDLQQRLLADVQAHRDRAYLVLVEHEPPVITLGRRARGEHVLASPRRLRELGVEIHPSARGGDVTWHGPGQLVAYPIVPLNVHRRTVRGHVRSLEEAAIRVLDAYGLRAERRERFPGAWVNGQKVAAVGVAVHRWVTWHGLALNVSRELPGFELIVPCGLEGVRATSLSRLLDQDVAVEEVRPKLASILRDVLGFDRLRHAPSGRDLL